MIEICFVCTGNTCRSIMAERLMKKQLKILGIKDVKVFSRGFEARGENITENAKTALKKMRCSSCNRKSIKLKKKAENTLYITMTELQKRELAGYKVLSMRDIFGKEIDDPYGKSLEVYLRCAQSLDVAVKNIVELILKERRDKNDNFSQ